MKGISFGDVAYRHDESPDFAFTSDSIARVAGRGIAYKSIYTIFDTGTSFTMIPANYWKPFTE